MLEVLVLTVSALLAHGDANRAISAFRRLRPFSIASMKTFNVSDQSILRLFADMDDPRIEKYTPIEVDGVTVIPNLRTQMLEPLLGRCYKSHHHLQDSVRLWRERRPDVAFKLLEKIIHQHQESAPEVAERAMHMSIDIAQIHDNYPAIKKYAEAIIERNPYDVHALFVLALYHSCAHDMRSRLNVEPETSKLLKVFKGNDASDGDGEDSWKGRMVAKDHEAYMRALESASPFFYEVLKEIREKVVTAWDKTTPQGNVPIEDLRSKNVNSNGEIICIPGWGPIHFDKEAGAYKALAPMMERIEAGFQMAEAFPQAKIIATGGAVPTGDGRSLMEMEAVFIKHKLVKNNAALEKRILVDFKSRDSNGNALYIADYVKKNAQGARVFIVGSDWQNPRYAAILAGTFETMQASATVEQVQAGGAYNEEVIPGVGKDLNERILIEQVALWRDIARSMGFFEECDFEEPVESGLMFILVFSGAVPLIICSVAAYWYYRNFASRETQKRGLPLRQSGHMEVELT